jgi:hypothetical protein
VGRRSRKRAGSPAPSTAPDEGNAAPAAEPSPARKRHDRRGERPQAPWGSFPLSEIVVLAAIVFLVASFIIGGRGGMIALIAGLVLGSLAGLELALRDHLAGYRSHSTVLGGAAAILAGLPVFFAGAPRWVVILVAVAVFAVAFSAARELFKRRTGGIGFR